MATTQETIYTFAVDCPGCRDRFDQRGRLQMSASQPHKHDHQVACVSSGYRTMAGTDWPVYSILERTADHLPARGGKWRVTWGICNGIPVGSSRYRTKREALDAMGFPT